MTFLSPVYVNWYQTLRIAPNKIELINSAIETCVFHNLETNLKVIIYGG